MNAMTKWLKRIAKRFEWIFRGNHYEQEAWDNLLVGYSQMLLYTGSVAKLALENPRL
jgi:hypothetical protein